MGASCSVPQKSVHEFTVKDSKNREVDLSICFKMNSSFTNSNYTQLTELYNKYKDKGFEILAFPCNQFLNQEPGTAEEAQQFACTRFKANYPVFQKVHVNGKNAAPIYKFLKASSKNGIFGSSIKWNFTKFLVDKEGHLIQRYATITSPLAIEADIQKALGQVVRNI